MLPLSIREMLLGRHDSFVGSKKEKGVIEGLSFEALEEEEARNLEVFFLEEEVLGALWELNSDKASDVVLIANEAIDSMLKKKGSDLLCKLDIEKAYGHVNWEFLLAILAKTGSKGLRQRDPISPYLFVIAMEALSRLILRAQVGGFISGFKVSHVGVKINLEKSEMIPMGEVDNLEELACEIGCKVGKLPSSCLGLPLGASYKSMVVWGGVEEQCDSLWKKIIRGKFGEEEEGWKSGVVRDSYGFRAWTEIEKQWELFNSMISFVVGNWRRVKFWKDKWCNKKPLCETFLPLSVLSDSKEAW
ncbi:hypothetical protein CK203_051348 [Vitis vinifera]|uniref:Reverse transcriptase domain-containing protein n=1 Tax=Vitis vinifera TaxID=29760 RepID=A0A438FLS7_VITVI|nr:hypothetical protein CK203_051348 [Vitis vinifera]